MQPQPPSAPNVPSPPSRPGFSAGPGVVIGLIALVAFVYVMDHVGKGETAVFGGVERHISAQDFHGAQCTAVFGACKIDLRDAQMQGNEATLETYAVFGGVEIRIPEDWEVVNRSTAIFGGIGDQRRHAPTGPDTKTLILEGAAVFGGVQIKN
jgi:hypothetical protein